MTIAPVRDMAQQPCDDVKPIAGEPVRIGSLRPVRRVSGIRVLSWRVRVLPKKRMGAYRLASTGACGVRRGRGGALS